MRYDQLRSTLSSIAEAARSDLARQDNSLIMEYHLNNRERLRQLICAGTRAGKLTPQTRKMPLQLGPVSIREAAEAAAPTVDANRRTISGDC